MGNSITPWDLPGLCERVRAAVHEGSPIVCDVSGLVDPDLGTVDLLARLKLTVKRLGGALELRGHNDRLAELLALTGLREELCLEVVREAEEREETLGVEEEADAGDLSAGDLEDL